MQAQPVNATWQRFDSAGEARLREQGRADGRAEDVEEAVDVAGRGHARRVQEIRHRLNRRNVWSSFAMHTRLILT